MGEPGRALSLPGTSADCAGQAPAGSWARGQGLQTALSPPTAPSSRPRGWLEAPPTFLSSQHTHPPLHFILFAQMRAPWSPLQPQPCLPSCLNMSGAPPLLCPVPPPVLCTLSPPITFKTKAKECLHLSLQDLILSGHPTQLCGLSPHPVSSLFTPLQPQPRPLQQNIPSRLLPQDLCSHCTVWVSFPRYAQHRLGAPSLPSGPCSRIPRWERLT